MAQTVVQSVEDGDFSEAAKKRIENMSRIGQANEKYAMDVAKEMEQRFRDGTLNYHYQPEHRLYEGGPKAKFRNNVEAIFFLLIKVLMNLANEGSEDDFDQMLSEAVKLGVDYMQKKDFQINSFLQDTANLRELAEKL